MYAMLKPGGTLGVVDHRLPDITKPTRFSTVTSPADRRRPR
jgi:predicted methyltransferase